RPPKSKNTRDASQSQNVPNGSERRRNGHDERPISRDPHGKPERRSLGLTGPLFTKARPSPSLVDLRGLRPASWTPSTSVPCSLALVLYLRPAPPRRCTANSDTSPQNRAHTQPQTDPQS